MRGIVKRVFHEAREGNRTDPANFGPNLFNQRGIARIHAGILRAQPSQRNDATTNSPGRGRLDLGLRRRHQTGNRVTQTIPINRLD